MAKSNGNGSRRSSSGSRQNASGEPMKIGIDTFGAIEVPPAAPGYCELPPTRFEGARFKVSVLQHMGDRRTQEDRFLIAPLIRDSQEGKDSPAAFFGVFDGTVGDFASDNIKDIILPTLLEQESWSKLRSGAIGEKEKLLSNALHNTFREADTKLLERCSRHQQHYATSTGVVVVQAYDMLVVGHLGDSRVVFGEDVRNGELQGRQVTNDHKPDMESEKRRIESCGGMVERLINHNNKPFIRGGDFMMRKALGEQPMQLQYSRAFGGKDLKIFGLSNSPDISYHPQNRVKWIVLASDGLWDVISDKQAVALAESADQQGNNPAAALVRAALLEQSKRKARADNITVVCVQLD